MANKSKSVKAAHPAGTRFEVLERSGEGTFFQVYKARDKTNERVCAVKSVVPAFAEDVALTHALQQSAIHLADLSHPSIARVFEADGEGDSATLIVEYVRGINLKERIRRIAPFTLSVAVDFLIAMAEGIQYAHARGIVHGDLRPQNVIVSPEGGVKVTDFGMSEALDASPRAASANLERAVYYQAPELADGGRPSIASDIYALGAILYEMLTGTPPFQGDTPGLIADMHRASPVPSPRAMNPGVPRSVEGIVMKALQKAPKDRYQSVSDLLGDLKSVRDALRFGKPLSWSPGDSVKSEPIAIEPIAAQAERIETRPNPGLTAREPEDGGTFRMAATATDDRISPLLKFALASVVFILLTSMIVGAALWMAVFSKPPEVKFPELVGMKVDAARVAASKAGVRVIEHEEFNDKFDPSVIYRTDIIPGRQVRQGRVVNVWVSKGSRMVWVPSVIKGFAQDAEQKLKAAGLTLGQVDRQYDDHIPFGSVVSQNPRAGKRINRDTAVSLVVSDGPKPQPEPTTTEESNPSPGIGGTPETEMSKPPDEPNVSPPDETMRRYDLKVKVNADGRGRRRVRVEYDDMHGTHPVIDEEDDEGEVIQQRVEVFGPRITIRVYYGDDVAPVLEYSKNLSSRRR